MLDERLIASAPDSVPPEVVAAGAERERALLARLLQLRSASEHPLGALPVVVLTRGDEANRGREDSHRALAELSTNSRHAVVAGAGHEIHLFQPAVVVQAIQDVIESVRTRSALQKR